ncbi:UPF0149 family protein [Sphingomonas sp. LB2R24]|uniref:UPF0149 family protein n=1 Tax=Sphingomonas sorbitolis TaxID=3096165 RepID=UPI002FCBCDD5
MKPRPSRLRRLDDALADLPLEEPMLLTELDGFLTGLLVGPEPIEQGEWLQSIWGLDEDGIAPFEDPLDVQWFVDAVMARYAEIARDLERGKLRPIFDVVERTGDILWELWIDGFADAMALRPESWDAVAAGDDAGAVDGLARLSVLIAIARNESALDSMEINEREDQAPVDLATSVLQLHASRLRAAAAVPLPTASAAPVKAGRNDPCPCGSGKKSKRCCG